jgi:hypothetical protein
MVKNLPVVEVEEVVEGHPSLEEGEGEAWSRVSQEEYLKQEKSK